MKITDVMKSFEKDFYEYTKSSREFFEKFSVVGVAGKEWSSLGFNNQNSNSSYYFYLTSPFYFLGAARLQFKRKNYRHDIYEEYSKGSILDFGAGVGGESFYFASKGADITYYEPNAIARDFMRFRAKKHKVEINILNPWEFESNSKKFDTIFCFDVFVINNENEGWTNSVKFEKYLRSHPEELKRYEKLKENGNGLSVREYYKRKILYINELLAKI